MFSTSKSYSSSSKPSYLFTSTAVATTSASHQKGIFLFSPDYSKISSTRKFSEGWSSDEDYPYPQSLVSTSELTSDTQTGPTKEISCMETNQFLAVSESIYDEDIIDDQICEVVHQLNSRLRQYEYVERQSDIAISNNEMFSTATSFLTPSKSIASASYIMTPDTFASTLDIFSPTPNTSASARDTFSLTQDIFLSTPDPFLPSLETFPLTLDTISPTLDTISPTLDTIAPTLDTIAPTLDTIAPTVVTSVSREKYSFLLSSDYAKTSITRQFVEDWISDEEQD